MKFLLAFFSLLFLCGLNAQEFCGTEEPQDYNFPTPEEIQNEIKRLKTMDKSNPRVFMITPFIIRSSTGSGGIYTWQVEQDLEKLNQDYAPINIQFEICDGIKEIRNNEFLELTFNEREKLLQNNVDLTINIYFVPEVLNSSGDNICGTSSFPSDQIPDRRIFMQNSCVGNGSTLTHEMGHFFNLLHTHSTFLGKERVKRINCNSTGDGFCDTPADPRLSSSVVSVSCLYTGNELDDYFDAYEPDPRNIMSYSTKSCRNEFSLEQQAVMSLSADNENSYHRSHCDLSDLSLIQLPDNIELNNFSEIDQSIKISANSVIESETFDYEINLVNNTLNKRYNISSGSLTTSESEVNNIFEVDYTIPFFNDLFSYDDIEIVLDPSNSIDETNEGNNTSILPLYFNYEIENSSSVFPNPAKNELSLYIKSFIQGTGSLQIFNATGQLYLEQEIRKLNTIFFRNLDVSYLLPGVYFIKFTIGEESETIRFLKL